jgi:hypothetical protein
MLYAISDAVIVALLTPISAAIVTLLGVITIRLGSIKHTGEDVKATGEVTHMLVNSQKTDMEQYQQILINTLNKAGIHVPADPGPSSTSKG